MKIHSLMLSAGVLFLASCATQKMTNSLHYPETKKVSQIDEYFGTIVEDPYRWLEDDRGRDARGHHLSDARAGEQARHLVAGGPFDYLGLRRQRASHLGQRHRARIFDGGRLDFDGS